MKHYEFTWEQRRNILTHNADRTEDGDLVWEGTLKKGESRQMKLTCALEGFRRPELVRCAPYSVSWGIPTRAITTEAAAITAITGREAGEAAVRAPVPVRAARVPAPAQEAEEPDAVRRISIIRQIKKKRNSGKSLKIF